MRQDLYQELYQVENNHWWHRHKRRLVHQLTNKYLTKQGKVLDIGAGTGKLLEELKAKGWQVSGIDGAKEAVEQSKRRGIRINQQELTKRLKFKANSFDLITSLDVLEHVEDDLALLNEMKRVVKPNGIIVVTVPAYQWLFSYWDKMLKHWRRYDKKDLVKLASQAQLKLELMSFYSSFFLLPSILVRGLKSRSKQQSLSDFQTTPLAFISVPILNILAVLERLLIRFIRLPVGMSLVCVFRKN
jgi:ubiquinone/menaquinone biosynthesis C-methylase UbiE